MPQWLTLKPWSRTQTWTQAVLAKSPLTEKHQCVHDQWHPSKTHFFDQKKNLHRSTQVSAEEVAVRNVNVRSKIAAGKSKPKPCVDRKNILATVHSYLRVRKKPERSTK